MKKFGYIIITTLIVIGVVWLIVTPGKVKVGIYDNFAKCIKDKGVKFFGAFWCPHCAAQKTRFGTATKYLPYIECSNPDGQTQTQICKDNQIMTYPTWDFPPGLIANSTTTVRKTGEQELTDLAQATSCVLPQ